MPEERQTPNDRRQESDHTSRREVLQQFGKYAAYTAPTLIALTLPQTGHGKAKNKPKDKPKNKPKPRPHVSGR